MSFSNFLILFIYKNINLHFFFFINKMHSSPRNLIEGNFGGNQLLAHNFFDKKTKNVDYILSLQKKLFFEAYCHLVSELRKKKNFFSPWMLVCIIGVIDCY